MADQTDREGLVFKVEAFDLLALRPEFKDFADLLSQFQFFQKFDVAEEDSVDERFVFGFEYFRLRGLLLGDRIGIKYGLPLTLGLEAHRPVFV